eukprot:234677-Prymnesium_polylepis.1
MAPDPPSERLVGSGEVRLQTELRRSSYSKDLETETGCTSSLFHTVCDPCVGLDLCVGPRSRRSRVSHACH